MSYYAGDYEVAVIGAGHAGCEAALACSRKGHKTLLFSISLECVANMPCNPNIGGTSKGHLVREIDALGGEMGKNIDKTFIQSRMLNTSKGPAVYSLRAQADRKKYQQEMKHTLEKQENLEILEAMVEDLIVDDKKIKGVILDTLNIYLAYKEFNDRKKLVFDQWRDIANDIIEINELNNIDLLEKENILYEDIGVFISSNLS